MFIAFDGANTAETCDNIIGENEGDDVVYLICFIGVYRNYFPPAITLCELFPVMCQRAILQQFTGVRMVRVMPKFRKIFGPDGRVQAWLKGE
ncbi:hypothetical protein N9N07_03130 [Pseudomonadales bacterium]|nr:hypothetical protein [Pseudomonadales bacterium]